jgi:predicted nucleic acid-binding protein
LIGVDTSVVVRYLVASPADQAARATRLFESDAEIGISLLVLLETAHVLRTQYGVGRADVLDGVVELITRANITTLELSKADALDALVRARSFPSVPIADALIAAVSRTSGAQPVYTFDRQFARLGTPVANP